MDSFVIDAEECTDKELEIVIIDVKGTRRSREIVEEGSESSYQNQDHSNVFMSSPL